MNDSEFDDFLKSSRAEMSLRGSFRQEVWQRIESAEEYCPPQITKFRTIMGAFARPWGAAASIAAMVAFGLWLGVATVPDAKNSQVTYAESITPFASTHGK